LAALALPAAGGTVTGELLIGSAGALVFEGSSSDGNETTLAVADPTADRTITLPNQTGTVLVSGNASIVNADVNASAAIAGTKINPDFGSQTVATTGIFSHALGSAGAPTITFTGDTNTGIYSPGADTLAFVEGGVEAMRIDSSGNVGIGTTSPSTYVQDNGLAVYRNANNSQPNFSVVNASTGGSAASVLQVLGGGGSCLITATSSGWGDFGILKSASTTIESQTNWLSFGAPNGFIFGTGATPYVEKMRIDSSGRVGIGTSSPAALLDVNGSTYFRTTLGLNIPNSLNKILDGTNSSPPASGGTAFNALALLPSTFTNQVNRVVLIYKGSDNSAPYNISPLTFTSKTYINDYGKGYYIGVFDYNGSAWVQDGSWLQLGASPATAGFNLDFPDSAGGVTRNASFSQFVSIIQYVVVSYDLFLSMGGFNVIDTNFSATRFSTAGAERMRIDSSGRVGIGTSSPTTLLDVNADTIRVRTARTPASASATGATGEICWDANYIYVCTATNTWKRTAINTW
jgi:hypothetical protein